MDLEQVLPTGQAPRARRPSPSRVLTLGYPAVFGPAQIPPFLLASPGTGLGLLDED